MMVGRQPKRIPRGGIDEYGRTPLINSISTESVDTISALIEGGCDVNAQDDNGYTALHFAVQHDRQDVLEMLLLNGADVNQIDRHGNGPLWTAVLKVRKEMAIVEVLLKNGADPLHKNQHGKSARDMAMQIGHGLDDLFDQY